MPKAKEIPVYLFRGFLESGKTTFIKNTLEDPYFFNGEKTLLIVCEEGEEEFEPSLLAEKNTIMVTVEEQDELNAAFLEELDKKYNPDRVMIEYNGTWILGDTLMIVSPDRWMYVQNICLIDASTYQNYMRFGVSSRSRISYSTFCVRLRLHVWMGVRWRETLLRP